MNAIKSFFLKVSLPRNCLCCLESNNNDRLIEKNAFPAIYVKTVG